MDATDLGIAIPMPEVESFCTRWDVVELALFGSVLNENFGPDSDVDVLLNFAPDARCSLFDLVKMREELRSIFGRDVDVLTKRAVESSRNPIRRSAILKSARTVYAAG